MFCKGCGTQLPENVKFCNKCGATQIAVQPAPVPVQQPAPIVQQPAPIPVQQPVPPVQQSSPPVQQYAPPPAQYAPVPAAKPKTGIIIGIAAAAVIITGLVITLILVLNNNNSGSSTGGREREEERETVIDSNIIGVWELDWNDVYDMGDGTWWDPLDGEYPSYTFRSDGTYSVTNTSKPVSGTYEISGSYITLTAGGVAVTSTFNVRGDTLTIITDYSLIVGDSEFTEVYIRAG